MKIVCDFCKAEYTLSKMPVGRVKCAVCGHVWNPHRPVHQNSFVKFLSALCALLAVCVFSVIIMFFPTNREDKNKPLLAKINSEDIRIVKDEGGNNRLLISGNITNTTDDVYGLPNIIIISYDSNGEMLSRQTFLPPVTLLESKTTVTFNYVLSKVVPTEVKRLNIELKESK